MTTSFRRDVERRKEVMVNEYADFHGREWLNTLTLAELICMRNAGRLDQPTLEGMDQ